MLSEMVLGRRFQVQTVGDTPEPLKLRRYLIALVCTIVSSALIGLGSVMPWKTIVPTAPAPTASATPGSSSLFGPPAPSASSSHGTARPSRASPTEPLAPPSTSPSRGTVHHWNTATVSGGQPVTCSDQANACGAIFAVNNGRPGVLYGGNTVTITATPDAGNSTFSLRVGSAITSPPSSTLCSDLMVHITDGENPAQQLYSGTVTGMAQLAVPSNGGNPNWSPGSANTFSFTLSLPADSPNADMGADCTVAYTWTQSSV